MTDFTIEKKIYYHDTDCGDVVYYANYLKYLEEARTEYLILKGIALPKLAEKHIWFVVARVEIEYKAPARYQDKLTVSARVEEARMATIKFFQEITRGDVLIARATTTLVCIGKDFKPIAMPEEVKKVIIQK
ncbi:MAG: acyl-CoA thioesterase [Nitrospirae bacterium]|nr:acyl-CoA thioesterase [Nitrospirota bacterium]MCL5423253.1 acyl-CoA thioesterase [Nitrospirota bacterium]